jgi:sugar (pentulose or hexulose) kinase
MVGGVRDLVAAGRLAARRGGERRRSAARTGGARRGVRGRPPRKLWNDTESAADAEWLLNQVPDGTAGWATACGSVPVASFTITKLSWLRRTEPASWDRFAHVVLPHD